MQITLIVNHILIPVVDGITKLQRVEKYKVENGNTKLSGYFETGRIFIL